jgi:hypothetical protein
MLGSVVPATDPATPTVSNTRDVDEHEGGSLTRPCGYAGNPLSGCAQQSSA